MRKLFLAATTYMAAGLAGGLFYREFTKLNGFPEGSVTQLGGVHTHLLALGTLVMLVVLALDKTMGLSKDRRFGWFFWVYNAGVVLTAAMMTVHGMLTVLGQPSSPAIAGMAGLGHMLVTAGFVLLFLILGAALRREPAVAVEAVV
ncbi:MAG TPA: DUF2871 domain-containing protein [Propionicimonas sp.]|jgi:hypothetical protein